jgi:hypothetical protein
VVTVASPDPEDLDAVRQDDELLDRISRGDIRPDDDETAHRLAEWVEETR